MLRSSVCVRSINVPPGATAPSCCSPASPGVGKSRLLYEFLRRLDGAGALELETTCASYGRAMAYRPIVEVLRRYLDLTDGVTGEEVRSRVAEQLQIPRLRGRRAGHLACPLPRRVAPRRNFSAACPVPSSRSGPSACFATSSSARARRRRSSSSSRTCTGSTRPRRSSSRILPRACPAIRVLLVLTTRPGYAPPWLAPPLAETITLEGLGGGDVRGMVRTLLVRGGGLRAALQDPRGEERGESSVRGGDSPPASGDERDRRREGRGAAEPLRRDGPGDHPRHHRGPRRPPRGPAQADAPGGGGGGATLRDFPGLSHPRGRPGARGRAPPGAPCPRLRLPERARTRADVQLQARAHPGRGVRGRAGAPAANGTTRRPGSVSRSCTPDGSTTSSS